MSINQWIANLVSIGLVFIFVVVTYFKRKFNYWKTQNIPFLPPEFFFGNCRRSLLGTENFGVTMRRIYDKMKSKGWKHGGIFISSTPYYIPIDSDYVKSLMETDFEFFPDRLLYGDGNREPLTAHALNLNGNKWKNLRGKLTPCFTPSQMKIMFEFFNESQRHLLAGIEKECLKNRPIDIKEICTRYTIDTIGTCAFGLDCKSFEEENCPFVIFGKKAFPTTSFRRFKMMLYTSFPKLAKRLKLRIFPKDVSDFFIKTIKDIVDFRQDKDHRKDLIQLLINMKNENLLSLEEVAAQCFGYFLAGYETTSTAMSFALYEIARNPEIQSKLREEIFSVMVKYGGKMTFDSIQELKYMNQVIDETLRLHSPVPVVNRMCVKDYKIPFENTVIKKGTKVIIPIWAIHHDPEYYPDPEKFDPERFTEENKSLRHGSCFLPFGKGPRICVGMRFGYVQAKVGLCCLLGNFKFAVSEKMPKVTEIQPHNIVLSAAGGIWLDVEKIESRNT